MRDAPLWDDVKDFLSRAGIKMPLSNQVLNANLGLREAALHKTRPGIVPLII